LKFSRNSVLVKVEDYWLLCLINIVYVICIALPKHVCQFYRQQGILAITQRATCSDYVARHVGIASTVTSLHCTTHIAVEQRKYTIANSKTNDTSFHSVLSPLSS